MIKAIIFDFDGVLILSERSRFKALKQSALKSRVIIPEESFSYLVGKTTKTFLGGILSARDKQVIPAIIADFEHTYKSNIELFIKPIDSTVSFIKQYKGPLVFAVASMSTRKILEKVLKHFDLYNKMTEIVGQDDVVLYKPHPEVYLIVLQRLGISAKEAIVLEDSVVGAQAAIQAGIPCYILLNGINAEGDFATMDIAGFIRTERDLIAIIEHEQDPVYTK